MLNNFIYAKTKALFEEQLNNGNILNEAIVFIEDTKEIWNHGHYFAGESIDPNAFAQLQTVVADLKEKSEESIIFLDESKITLPFGYIGADSQKYNCVPGLNDCGQIDGHYYGNVVVYLKVSSGTIFEERKISELTLSNPMRLQGGMIVAYAQNNHLFVENNTSSNFDVYFKGFYSHQTLPECFIPETVIHAITPITYSELKSLRDNSQLIPGRQYRITDYVTTTTQENTQSALHPFDIIVTADSENTLNEVARATQHDDDTYFADSDLNAWQIWYCLDNDTERFAWADDASGESKIGTIKPASGVNASGKYTYDTPISKVIYYGTTYNLEIGVKTMINSGPPVYVTKTNAYTLVVEEVSTGFIATGSGISVYGSHVGKGVIYRMIDEWNNDVAYDFKNILFMDMDKYKISAEANYYSSWWAGELIRDSSSDVQTVGPMYYAWILTNVSGPSSSGVWYTSNYNVPSEDTIFYESDGSGFYVSETIRITNIVIGQMQYTFGNTLSPDSTLSEFVDYTVPLHDVSHLCSNNIIKAVITDKQELNFILFGSFSSYNTFGSNCYNNIFGSNCMNNSFGNECHSNSFGNSCSNNIFGNNCTDNSFGVGCFDNSFGNHCFLNTFGVDCFDNSFGNGCSINSFGNGCVYNTFGNACSYNSFRSSASQTASLKNYVQYNHFDDECSYNVIWNSSTVSSAVLLKNINVNRGVHGTSSNYNFINIDTLNADYEIQVAKNSKGEIKIYCEADLIA